VYETREHGQVAYAVSRFVFEIQCSPTRWAIHAVVKTTTVVTDGSPPFSIACLNDETTEIAGDAPIVAHDSAGPNKTRASSESSGAAFLLLVNDRWTIPRASDFHRPRGKRPRRYCVQLFVVSGSVRYPFVSNTPIIFIFFTGLLPPPPTTE